VDTNKIEAHFQSLKSLDQGKMIYKRLARELHPDRGGDSESFKNLSNVYHRFIDDLQSKNSDIDIEIEKKASEVAHYDVDVEIVGKWIWISGDTKPIKEILKAKGFKWSKNKSMWYYGESKHRNTQSISMDEIRAKYGSIRKEREINNKYIDFDR
jgi:curved DNA-binding protein CbpA